MSQTARQRLGQTGEQAAATYLEHLGYHVITRNYRTRYGEIDIICRHPDGQTLVFVEVKTRRSALFGAPEEAVTPRKLAHIEAAAHLYMQQYPAGEAGDNDAAWRIAVVAIEVIIEAGITRRSIRLIEID